MDAWFRGPSICFFLFSDDGAVTVGGVSGVLDAAFRSVTYRCLDRGVFRLSVLAVV